MALRLVLLQAFESGSNMSLIQLLISMNLLVRNISPTTDVRSSPWMMTCCGRLIPLTNIILPAFQTSSASSEPTLSPVPVDERRVIQPTYSPPDRKKEPPVMFEDISSVLSQK